MRPADAFATRPPDAPRIRDPRHRARAPARLRRSGLGGAGRIVRIADNPAALGTVSEAHISADGSIVLFARQPLGSRAHTFDPAAFGVHTTNQPISNSRRRKTASIGRGEP